MSLDNSSSALHLNLPASSNAQQRAPTKITVHPSVAAAILTHHGRRPEESTAPRVIGTLMETRSDDGQEIDVRSCFAVPHSENEDQIAVDMPFQQGMMDDQGEKVVAGLLGACVTNIDDMRTRVTPVANLKIKNNLLSITLILTSLPGSVKISKAVVEQVGYAIGQYLGAGVERPELGLTAVHCASTLLSASLRSLPSSTNSAPTASPVLQHLTLHLLSPLISHISTLVVESATNSLPPTSLDELKEIVKALVTYATSSSLPMESKPRAMSILLPTLCLLLDPPDTPQSTPLHQLATSTLLGLAQREPTAFRDAMSTMAEGEREGLEKAVRGAVGSKAVDSAVPAERRGIELRSFG